MTAAIALTAGSFLALWLLFEGSCVIPDRLDDLTLYTALSALFAVGFVWVIYELALRLPWSHRITFIQHSSALFLGIAAYPLIGLATWLSNPGTVDGGVRTVVSITWPIGLLLHAGAFNDSTRS